MRVNQARRVCISGIGWVRVGEGSGSKAKWNRAEVERVWISRLTCGADMGVSPKDTSAFNVTGRPK